MDDHIDRRTPPVSSISYGIAQVRAQIRDCAEFGAAYIYYLGLAQVKLRMTEYFVNLEMQFPFRIELFLTRFTYIRLMSDTLNLEAKLEHQKGKAYYGWGLKLLSLALTAFGLACIYGGYVRTLPLLRQR